MSRTSRLLRSFAPAIRQFCRFEAVGRCSRGVFIAITAGLLLVSGCSQTALAQSCLTPQVEAEIRDLAKRLERYLTRLEKAQRDLAEERAAYNKRYADLGWQKADYGPVMDLENLVRHYEKIIRDLSAKLWRLESLPPCPSAPRISAGPPSAASQGALSGGKCHGAAAGADLRKRDPDPGIELSMSKECQWATGGNPH